MELQTKYIDISMPGYVQKALAEFHHELRRKKQYSPFPGAAKTYGNDSQSMRYSKPSPLLGKEAQTLIQQITGFFWYLGRGVDST